MKSLKYNLSLLFANALFALNFSLFVSIMEGASLSIEAIYLLQCLGLLVLTLSIRGSQRTTSQSAIRWRDMVAIALTAILSSLGWSYMTLWGMSLTSPIDAATIASVGPSLTLIFAHVLGRRKLTGPRISGVVVSLLGVAILVISRSKVIMSRGEVEGNTLLLGAVVIAAINTLIFKPQLERYGVIRVGLIYAIASSAVATPLFWRSLLDVQHLSLSLELSVELSLLLIIGGALPLMLLFEGTERLSPLHTSLYRYTQPLITAIVVVWRHQATLTAANYVAMGAIILGGILVAQGVDRSV